MINFKVLICFVLINVVLGGWILFDSVWYLNVFKLRSCCSQPSLLAIHSWTLSCKQWPHCGQLIKRPQTKSVGCAECPTHSLRLRHGSILLEDWIRIHHVHGVVWELYNICGPIRQNVIAVNLHIWMRCSSNHSLPHFYHGRAGAWDLVLLEAYLCRDQRNIEIVRFAESDRVYVMI